MSEYRQHLGKSRMLASICQRKYSELVLCAVQYMRICPSGSFKTDSMSNRMCVVYSAFSMCSFPACPVHTFFYTGKPIPCELEEYFLNYLPNFYFMVL